MELHEQPRSTAKFFTEKNITRREMQILRLMAEGNLYTDVARLLKLSTLTVRTHVKNVYLKLDAHNKIEALNKIEWPTASTLNTNMYVNQ